MRVGKQMQFFGARVNLAKALLYAINGGRDEMIGQADRARRSPPVVGDVLDYDDVLRQVRPTSSTGSRETYVDALNCIHYMHDKYAYERIEMALHDQEILRTMACGIAGLSVVADSLSAMKYATVRPVRDETGLVVDYIVEGDFPTFGNDDDRVDAIAVDLVESLHGQDPQAADLPRLAPHPVGADDHLQRRLRQAHRQHPGRPPRGRAVRPRRQPDERPRHPRHARQRALSVAKLPYEESQDGISLTDTVIPSGLGRDQGGADHQPGRHPRRVQRGSNGFHVNINVLNRETLEDAMEHPEKYPQLTIRVSGYAVNFVRLTREQQLDVLSRTFHGGAVRSRAAR